MFPGLTDRQREILLFVIRSTREEGFAPTVREIGRHFRIRSTNGIADHLKAIERKGYLARESQKSRALVPLLTAGEVEALTEQLESEKRKKGKGRKAPAKATRPGPVRRLRHEVEPAMGSGRTVGVPLVGRVAAGAPLLAAELEGDTVQIDSVLLGGHRKVFALKVKGDSMIGDGIFDGDYIFVKKHPTARNGEIVVAMIEDEATVKRLYREGDRIRLQPSNPRLKPIYVRKTDFRETQVLGIVVGVYRRMG